MVLSRVSLDDFLGIFFVRKGDTVKWDSYYGTIDSLRPMFEKEEFNDVISGFYLNVVGNNDAVRISYFVAPENVDMGVKLFKSFFEENGIQEIKGDEYPRETLIASAYGGPEYEQDFRTFLSLQNVIGLELLKNKSLYAKRLFATYRWQVRKAVFSIDAHFKYGLETHSPTFGDFSKEERTKFLELLGNWPNPPQVDWAHMMVNLVLGCDWIDLFGLLNYITPGRPTTIREINMHLDRANHNFRIPLDWTP